MAAVHDLLEQQQALYLFTIWSADCTKACQEVLVAWSISSCDVQKVYCGNVADWIQMLFGVVSGVGWGMGVLDGDLRASREVGVLVGVVLISMNGIFV